MKKSFCAVIVLLMSLVACGPLSPHVNVDANVNGSVDTSGTITIAYDIKSLLEFFTKQCKINLGPDATESEIDTCANASLGAFLQAFSSTPTPSTSPTP